MVCTAVYDNSRNNPANPDPTKEVGWGDQSWDEMMLGYFDVIIPRGSTEMKSMRSAVGPEMILRKFDKDKDKKISKEESQGNDLLSKGFILGDTNRDGFLDENEIDAVIKCLPPGYRDLIVLRHSRDLSYDEIAEVTGLPLGTVKNRLFRAREMMRQMFVERGFKGI